LHKLDSPAIFLLPAAFRGEQEKTVEPITLGGQPLKTNADGLVSLTDLYEAAKAIGAADGYACVDDYGNLVQVSP